MDRGLGPFDSRIVHMFRHPAEGRKYVWAEAHTSIIWPTRTIHDLRRTFATRLRANGVHEYDISDLLGHSKPGVTKVYARATRVVLEQAVEKFTEPWGQVIELERRAG